MYKSKPISIMHIGGQSNKSLKNIINSNLEAISIMKKNNLNFSYLRILLKLVIKLYLLIKFRFKNEYN